MSTCCTLLAPLLLLLVVLSVDARVYSGLVELRYVNITDDSTAPPTTTVFPTFAPPYAVLADSFGIADGGYISLNLSITTMAHSSDDGGDCILWQQLDALQPRSVYLPLFPSVVGALQESGVYHRLPSDPFAVSQSEDAKELIAKQVLIFGRLIRTSVWDAVTQETQKPLTQRQLCQLPYVASCMVQVRYDRTSQRTVLLRPSATSLCFEKIITVSDFVTTVLMQCSNVPVRFNFELSLINSGGVQSSFSDIPYFSVFSVFSALYALLWVLWVVYLAGCVIDQLQRQPSVRDDAAITSGASVTMAAPPPSGSSTAALPPPSSPTAMSYLSTRVRWIASAVPYSWTRMELFVLILISLKVIQCVAEVEKNSILQQSRRDQDDAASRLDQLSQAMNILTSVLIFGSLMTCPMGWGMLPREGAPQLRRFVTGAKLGAAMIACVVFFGLLLACAASSTSQCDSIDNTLSVLLVLVYGCGILFAMLQLRLHLDRLKRMLRCAVDTETMRFFLRLHSLMMPMVLYLVLLAFIGLVQSSVLQSESSLFLRDALKEFRMTYWIGILMLCLRRDIVVA